MSGSILFIPPYTRGEKKNIWSEKELNPGPLASQVTALTTRPWLLGHLKTLYNLFIKWTPGDEIRDSSKTGKVELRLKLGVASDEIGTSDKKWRNTEKVSKLGWHEPRLGLEGSPFTKLNTAVARAHPSLRIEGKANS